MNVHERILSIILLEKVMSDPKHANKIGVSIINQEAYNKGHSLQHNNEKHYSSTKEET